MDKLTTARKVEMQEILNSFEKGIGDQYVELVAQAEKDIKRTLDKGGW